ncbi:MAG: MMPL family transporter [Verrucomicrobia bacterium]|nr:MMPL family transporter [Verrucomicrobiota bacterium]
MRSPFESFPARMLRVLAGCVYRYPRLFFYPHAVLFLLAVFYTVERLEFSTSRDNLVGSNKRYHTNFLQFKKEFAVQDDHVAVVESEDREKNRQFVERLGAKLEAETNLFKGVFYKGDLKMMGPKALLFLPETTLADLHQTLKDYRPFLQHFAQATNLNSLFRQINHQFRTAKQEENSENKSLIGALPALRRIVQQATDSLNRPGTPPSPGISALFNAGEQAEEQQYVTFAQGRIYLVSARARTRELDRMAVKRLRELVHDTQKEVPGVNVGITGESVLEYDEMNQSQQDSIVASVVSLVLCALLFIVAYRETGRPIKAIACLVVGLGYTMGYATWAVGHLNILTVTFLPILIGLAIDFGIHLITRYEEELRRGRAVREAVEKAIVNTGLGIFTGCFTTAGAFFAMGLTDFKGIQEMGIITGGGMLICLVPMMTLLPVLLMRGNQNAMDQHTAQIDRRARIERLWLGRPVWVTAITLALCGLSFAQFGRVHFDYNLLNMQAKGLPAVEFERKLIDGASKSVLFAAVVANSVPEAVQLEPQLTNLPAVSSVDSMSRFLAENQTAKLSLVKQIKEELAPICFAETDGQLLSPAELRETLGFTQSYLSLAGKAVEKEGDTKLFQELEALWNAIEELRHRMSLGEPAKDSAKLTAFQRALFADIHQTFDALKTQDDRAPLRAEDLPESLRTRFIGKSGKQLLQVYPKADVWQREKQQEFIEQIRTVDPNVTGTPVQLFEYTRLLKESYEEAAGYALGAIALLVLLHFRRISSVILALLPVGIGMTWLAGLMGFLGIPFNPANIMTLPLVIGIGVTNGVHILNRFAEEKNPGILAKSTGKAVLVSGLTTIAGFGSLIPAKHQGIAGLGIVMSVGVATCMIAALTFLPALLSLTTRVKTRKPSGDSLLSTLGQEEPR